VAKIVYRHAANVHFDLTRNQGGKDLFGAIEGVINLQHRR
jgi:hypothetical protein